MDRRNKSREKKTLRSRQQMNCRLSESGEKVTQKIYIFKTFYTFKKSLKFKKKLKKKPKNKKL